MFAGIDVGSRTTKAVVLNQKEIISSAIIDTGSNPKKAGETVFHLALRQIGLKKDTIRRIVGTGYGRISLSFVHKAITELSCHAKGAHFINHDIRTVIDIGGQDSKVIRLDENGNMTDFVMNDKCAAGTGRFLEVIAGALEMDMDAFGRISSTTENPCTINNMCTVFAESEVISLLARGEEKEKIVAGINQAFSMRLGNMVHRVSLKAPVVFVGGVAKNTGLKKALSKLLSIDFAPFSLDPQLVGALGAAVMARDMASN